MKRALTATTAQTSETIKNNARLAKVHAAALSEANRQFEACLLGGTLALAAWTVLFAAPPDGPISRIGNQTLSLLLIATTVLLSGPLLGRRNGSHLTFMIRETSTYVGFSASVFALCSAIADLAGKGWTVMALILAAAITVRDLIEDGVNISMNRDLLTDENPSQGTTRRVEG
ncbi:hypothetical protein ABT142_26720 [Streptomyces sp. NPDC001857]|uniref:hypothetical protein n=1 Tax=unclassified Streptomyces TaxID=2593676 RepID=UPI00331C1CDA